MPLRFRHGAWSQVSSAPQHIETGGIVSAIPVPVFSAGTLKQMGFNMDPSAVAAFSSSLGSWCEQVRPGLEKLSLARHSYEAELRRINPELMCQLDRAVTGLSVSLSLRTAPSTKPTYASKPTFGTPQLRPTVLHLPVQATTISDSPKASSVDD